jgi:hypothetical protein
MDQEAERQRLRKERDRLHQQIAQLVAKSALIKHGGVALQREQHREDLDQHQREFQVFRADLERFHRLFGPLGE